MSVRQQVVFENGLRDLERVSGEIGKRGDYVQGGGGNTSVKLDGEWMAVKASGYKLSQVTHKDGFAVINYRKVKEYMDGVRLDAGIDYENDSVGFIRKNVLELAGVTPLRPSVEAGFHSILQNVVIHTHPVYSNVLSCSIKGRDMLGRIFADSGIGMLWVPCIKPGFSLSYYIMNKRMESIAASGRDIGIVFLENHGLIVADDDARECLRIHDEANERIKRELGLRKYPEVKIAKIDDDTYRSDTDMVLEFVRGNGIDIEYLNEYVLYPDQIVYLNEYLDKKIFIGNGEVIYRANRSEALAFEDSLAAYFYIIDQIKSLSLGIKNMPSEEADYIKNWEAEKFRRTVLGKE